MEAPFYIISDNHFMMEDNSKERNRRNKLFSILEVIKKQGKGTLIIGGDFFDFWFETKYVIPNGYKNLIEQLKELSLSGIKIHYLAGNHDYWDFGYLEKTIGLTFHKGDLNFQFNNKNILITHGDGLLKADYGYKILKKIIRHPIFINFFKLIPAKISFKLANKISRSSSEYNHNDKFIDVIMHDIYNYALKQWKQNIDIVMVGHYHQQKIVNDDMGTLIFLGDWLTKFSVTTLNVDEIWQGNWEEFIKKLA